MKLRQLGQVLQLAQRRKIARPIELATVAKPIKPTAVAVDESVRQWFKSCVVAGPTETPAGASEGSYVPWCEEQGIKPVSLHHCSAVALP